MNEASNESSADGPIFAPEQDTLGRLPFAQRVAAIIERRNDTSGLVIGVYGPWGDGKTSTLNLLAGQLADAEGIVTVRFNPWLFESQVDLTLSFLATLADVLGKKLNSKEKLGKLLERCSPLASLVSVSVGGVVRVDPGKGIEKLGERLSNLTIDESRQRFEEILEQEGKTVVVFIDDIDRLDRRDMHTMLRMVKLSAGFDRVVYVLAFDEEVVSEAIGREYGDAGGKSGRKFLEKIVQVPLPLPPADPVKLTQPVYAGLTEILGASAIDLSESEVWRLQKHFQQALLPRLTTPRQVRRYINAAEFAVPVLKGEVDTVDQLLIEGLRVFYPELYAAVRSNPSVFLGQERLALDRKEWRNESQATVAALLKPYPVEDAEHVNGLLCALFPELERTMSGSELEEVAKDRRACVRDYFPRFFHYGIPPDDVSDQRVRELLDTTGEELSAAMSRLAANIRSAGLLIDKLQALEDDELSLKALDLASAIAENSTLFPDVGGILGMQTLRFRAARFATRLVDIVAPGESAAIAENIARRATPPFVAEFLKSLRIFKLSETLQEVGRVELVRRLVELSAVEPVYARWPSDAGLLLWFWHQQDANSLSDHLRLRLNSEPRDAPALLIALCPIAYGAGLPHRVEFDGHHYGSVIQLVDPAVVTAAIAEEFGEVEASREAYFDRSLTDDERVVREFMYQHESAKPGD